MTDLLFEIGTEELPPNLIENLTSQVKQNITSELNEKSIIIKETDITTFNSPRRIAILIKNLPEKTEVKEVEIKGPDKKKAFQDDKPTQVAIGFAKKYNLEPKDLEIKIFNNSEYVFIKTKTGGEDIKSILEKTLPNSLKKTTGDKFMKWGNYEEKFARPIRWIVAILDNEIIRFTYANVESSNFTYGHRFLSKGQIKVSSPSEYERTLRKNNVIALPEERRKIITERIEQEAKTANNGLPTYDEDLLKEVVNITENPNSLLCSFDEHFLSLPKCIIETVLKKHQRYFVLNKSSNTNELLNQFIAITNGSDEKNKSLIKRGNEKVVRARLNDAQFFFFEDLKRPFTYEERINDLSKVTFQKGLGSMKEKAERIIELSTYIYDHISQGKEDIISPYNPQVKCSKKNILESARLCKLDLATQMVFEMPELQGKVGSEYAKRNNFPDSVCKGIEGQYENHSNSSIYLNNTTGMIIGISDRIDNLISLFSINKIPTSSADPFALRGQTNWLFTTIESIQDQYNVTFKLLEIINYYAENIFNHKISDDTVNQVSKFLLERLKLKYETSHSGFKDLTEAVFVIGKPLNNIYEAKDKLILLTHHFGINTKEEDKEFLTAAKRLVRIVEGTTNGNTDLKILTLEEEKTLLRLFEETDKISHKDLDEYYTTLKKLTKPINNFFEKVLVNDPDPKIKQARHALLTKGKNLFERICDFNQIVDRN